MREVNDAPSWLLNKLETGSLDEIIKIRTVMFGVWFWRNKKIWEGKEVTNNVAMDCSFGHVKEWQEARQRKDTQGSVQCRKVGSSAQKWVAPSENAYKVNVDASFFPRIATSQWECLSEITMESF